MVTPINGIQELKGTTYAMVETSSVIAAINEHARQFKFAVASSRTEKERKIEVICVHGGKDRNRHKITSQTRLRQTTTKKTICPWKMLLKWRKTTKVWIVNQVSSLETHNHPLDKTPEFYHQHRKPTEQMRQTIVTMTASSIRPSVIQDQIREDDSGIVMTQRDLYNFQKLLLKQDNSSSFTRVFEWLHDRQYVIRYNADRKNALLNALFFTHPSAVVKGQRFKEIIALDAIYAVSTNKMPLVNIVAVSNLGTNKLRNILLGSAFIVNETAATYEWLLQTMKETIWTNGDVGIIMTDNDHALTKAISIVFPRSTHVLCGWHVQMHLN